MPSAIPGIVGGYTQQEYILMLDTALHEEVDYTFFTNSVNPHFEWYRHNVLLKDVLEKVVSRELLRLMVFEPPRHGKSEQISRILPAYFEYKHPELWTGLVSYGADLAYDFSRAARDNYLAMGRTLGAKQGVEMWHTGAGGGMWAAGIHGPQSGKGFHLGIVDDPLKDAQEAASAATRLDVQNWWESTFFTRQEPGAAIVLVMTRWDEDDLAGFLLANESDPNRAPEYWHIVCLPAIRDSHIYTFPATCTVEPDWRKRGSMEPLCPERYPTATLKSIMSGAGVYYREALYQQRPSSVVGKGRVYHAYDDDNVEPSIPKYSKPLRIKLKGKWAVRGDAELHIGMDFNVNPMSAVVYRRVADQLHQIGEIEISDATTDIMCNEIEERYPGTRIIVYPDPSARQRRTSAPVGVTDLRIIKQHGFGVVCPTHAPPQVDRYNSVNVLLGEPGGREPRLFIHPDCVRTRECFTKMTYKPGSKFEPDKTKGYDHLTDAAGYLIWSLFPVQYKRGTNLVDLYR